MSFGGSTLKKIKKDFKSSPLKIFLIKLNAQSNLEKESKNLYLWESEWTQNVSYTVRNL